MKSARQMRDKCAYTWAVGVKRIVVAALLLATVSVVAPARASQERWHVWDQHLLELSELMGGMHYLRRLCGDYRDQLWRWRMIDVIEWENAEGERRDRLVSRFNQGYNGTRQWHDRCSASARLKIEHFDAMSIDILAWFSANEPF